MGKDIFRVILDSENPTNETSTLGEYDFNIRLPFTRSDYKEYVLYVDNFNISLKGLTTEAVSVRLTNVSNYNSYSSQTGGNNNSILQIYNPNITSGRTDDLILSYQGANSPYYISSIPNTLSLKICNMDGNHIDLSSANNFWTLNLRLECIYNDDMC